MKITPFQLERFFDRYEFKAPYLLCSSDCESLTIQDLLDFDRSAETELKQLWLGYTESPGHPVLRQEISQIYDNISADEVLVHTGAEEAIFLFMNAMLTQKDHIIVHYPAYQSLFEVARAIGCEVTLWNTESENNWQLDLDFLQDHLKDNTRAIVVNCPHNPTGYLMTQENFRQLVDISQTHGILLFSDEVYRFLEYDAANRLPAACDSYENAISLGVMSKSFGLAGLRIGWIATKNQSVYKEMATLKDYTSICNSAPSEYLSITALRHKEKIVQRNLEIVAQNLDRFRTFMQKYSDLFSWIPPKAGSITFPGLKAEKDCTDFCVDLLNKKGVLLAPGKYFGDPQHFRVGLGRKNFPVALSKFEEYLE